MKYHYFIIIANMVLLFTACDGNKKSNHAGHDDHKDHEKKDEHSHGNHDNHGGHDHGAHQDEEGVINLSKEAIARAEIVSRPVEEMALNATLRTIAEIELDPGRVAHVSPFMQSKLIEVYGQVGQKVEPSTKLAKLRSVEVGQANAMWQQARAELTAAKQSVMRLRKLHQQKITSANALNEAERRYQVAISQERSTRATASFLGDRKSRSADTIVRSPIKGTIIERHATVGEVAGSNNVLFKVADTSHVWAIGQVFEQDAGKVRKGQAVTLTLRAYPGRSWKGKIDFVQPVLQHDTHSIPVRVALDNKDGILKPGFFGSFQIQLETDSPKRPVVPENAIQEMKGKQVVFIDARGSGRYEKRVVSTGLRRDGLVEIFKGLRKGERIVTQGAFILKSHLLKEELGHGHAH